MTTEFSAAARLKVEVDKRSLKSAEQTIEDRMGSVRAGLSTDGGHTPTGSVRAGGSSDTIGGLSSARSLLTAQLEKLDDIADLLEKQAVSEAQSGGTSNSLLAANLTRGGISGAASGGIGALGSMAAGGVSGAALGAGGVVAGGMGGLALLLNELQPDTKTTGDPLRDAKVRGTKTGLRDIQDRLNIDNNGQVKLQMPSPSELPTLSIPNASDLPTLPLPGESAVNSLHLGLPGESAVNSLHLGIPGESTVSSLTLGVPMQSSLPKLDVVNDLPKLKINAQSIRELLGLDEKPNRDRPSNPRGPNGDVNVTVDAPVTGPISEQELERRFDEVKQDAIDEVKKLFSGF